MSHETSNGAGESVKMDKDLLKMVEVFVFEDVFAKLIEWETIQPGIILGAVDLICQECGAVSTHEPNDDGSCRYVCPTCGMANRMQPGGP